MKKVRIKVTGEGECWWLENLNEGVDLNMIDTYDTLFDLEQEGFTDEDLYEYFAFKSDIHVSVINETDEEIEDITGKKGKYVKSKTIYSKPFRPNAVAVLMGGGFNEITFTIELEDNEDFDSKKLQLIKSDYEFEFLPFGVVSEFIMYDGKMIQQDPDQGWERLDTKCIEIIDYKLPYGTY